MPDDIFYTPEATNTGRGFNWGSGGGARGCGAYARTEGESFPIAHDAC